MKSVSALVAAIAFIATTTPALANESAPRERMRNCNVEAKALGLKGDDYRAHMRTCLSSRERTGERAAERRPDAAGGKPAADDNAKPLPEPTPAQLAQRERMRTCAGEAKQQGLKGDDYRAHMRSCLSRDGAASRRATESLR